MPKGHFPFHAGDFLTDERVLAMTLEQQGAYVRLLCHNWIEGSIPADTNVLARLVGVSHGEFGELWDVVAPCFTPTGDGRLCNQRMGHELNVYQRRVVGGRRGAQIRWTQQVNGSPIKEPHDNQQTSKPRTNKPTDYSGDFERAWQLLPKRDGGNPKKRAWQAWRARLRGGASVGELTQAAENYAADVRARGKENTEFVMQAATFFGPAERWREHNQGPGAMVTCNGCGKSVPESRALHSDYFWYCHPCAKKCSDYDQLKARNDRRQKDGAP